MSEWYREVNDGESVEEIPDGRYDLIPSFEKKTKWQKRETVKTPFGNVDVSTVFLALDHSWNSPIPVLYETMVFGGPLDRECERYTTRKLALEGHERFKALVMNNPPVPDRRSGKDRRTK